jgi:hypothetical protein
MVSIVAEEIYNGTDTISYSNGQRWSADVDGWNFASENVTNLSGFTYGEFIFAELELLDNLELENTSSSSRTASLDILPSFVFDNSANLFADVTAGNVIVAKIFPINNITLPANTVLTTAIPLDTYVDNPATSSAETETQGPTDIKTLASSSTEAELRLKVVGRQP